MNKDPNAGKQIEELARSFCGFSKTLKCRECSYECHQKEYARKAYEAGYRLTSDVAREIFEEIESCKWSETQYGDQMLCFEINSEKYAELKKKYESEKDDG